MPQADRDLTKIWVRVPGPGQFRGKGQWYRADKVQFDHPTNDALDWIERTGYVPIHHGDAPPGDDVDAGSNETSRTADDQ